VTPPLDLDRALDAATDGLGLDEREPPPPPMTIAGQRRARRAPRPRLMTLALTDVDGVLRFEPGVPPRRVGRRRRRGPAVGLGGTVHREFRFAELPLSEVGRYLGALDRKLNPSVGLRQVRWTAGGGVLDAPRELGTGRTLLFVHGTFSRSEALIGGLNATAEGRAFLQAVTATSARSRRYAQVLAFDHPTLGASPVMNAFDLARATQGLAGPIDVICHSRGGLVTRWWLTGFRPDFGDARVVFVGSPLAGTSLAAPPRLKEALEFVANIGQAFLGAASLASVAVPFLSVATGLMKVVTSVTSLTTRTPLLDAVMAMIPGLAAQGRVGDNPELGRLHLLTGAPPPGWFAVRSNFEPKATGWRFWQRFVRLRSDLTNAASDLVFQAENDLVVDTGSMTSLADTIEIPPDRVLDFQTSDVVHHCNYFEQPETIRFLRTVLKVS
jgi:hypothetical protein